MAESSQQSRTEQATPRRLERAQQEGQIAYSTDLTSATMLLIVSLIFSIFAEYFFTNITRSVASFVSMIRWIHTVDSFEFELLGHVTYDFIQISFPVVAVAALTTLVSAGLMTGFRVSPKAMKFDPSKLHPRNGAKRMFSSRSVMRGATAIGKFIVLLSIAGLVIYMKRDQLMIIDSSIESLVRFGWLLTINLALSISGGLLAIGLLDFMYQKWKHQQDMKMTRQEVVDEHREDEGDPHMRARLKKLQREMNQRRSLGEVPGATVVVTNPTHFAVALKYERGTMDTPRVVAKGADHMAHRIIEIARENKVVIVERKPLARALYYNVPVGADIPLDLFQAVAEVISYVYSLQRAA